MITNNKMLLEETTLFDFPNQFSTWLNSKSLDNNIGKEKRFIRCIIDTRMRSTGFLDYLPSIDPDEFLLDSFVINPIHEMPKTVYIASGFIEKNTDNVGYSYGLRNDANGYLIRYKNLYNSEAIIIKDPIIHRLSYLQTIFDNELKLQDKFKEYRKQIFSYWDNKVDTDCSVRIFSTCDIPIDLKNELVEVSRQNKLIIEISKLIKYLYPSTIDKKDKKIELIHLIQDQKDRSKLYSISIYELIALASIYKFTLDRLNIVTVDEDENDYLIGHVVKSYLSLTEIVKDIDKDLSAAYIDLTPMIKTIKYILSDEIQESAKGNMTVQIIMLQDYIKYLNRRIYNNNEQNNK